MRFVDGQFHTPGMQLACDDVLLDLCDADPDREVLRFWAPATYFVVAGYTNRILDEVRVDACVERGIPLYRRTTGGGTVVQGPGCVNYALVLRIERDPALSSISTTNAYVLDIIASVVGRQLGLPVERCGHTDLALNGRKFSGNAQRRKGNAVLFHGSILLSFDLDLIGHLLPMPSAQPAYRANRDHAEFLTNIPLVAADLRDALRTAWSATTEEPSIPIDAIRSLAESRYLNHEWTYRF